MRILLDESLPRDLAPLIVGHEAVTIQQAGWSSTKNGKLLALAADKQFDVFVTADRNTEFQQNLKLLPIAIVVFRARNNRMEALEPLIPELLQLPSHIQPRTLRKVGHPVD
jgi:predicted nuclease of predicted toxin-antitoxin system